MYEYVKEYADTEGVIARITAFPEYDLQRIPMGREPATNAAKRCTFLRQKRINGFHLLRT
jgi:hypothetical protein